MAVNRLTECADMRSCAGSARQQLHGRERRFLGIVFGADAMPAALLPDMFAKKLVGLRVQNTDVKGMLLELDDLSDPDRRSAVVSLRDFDAAVDVHGAIVVLRVTDRLERLGQHVRDHFWVDRPY